MWGLKATKTQIIFMIFYLSKNHKDKKVHKTKYLNLTHNFCHSVGIIWYRTPTYLIIQAALVHITILNSKMI